MTDLRCLSLDQPYASLIAIGVKTIETRSWSTKHRGRIGIASTAKKPIEGDEIGDTGWYSEYDVDHWIINNWRQTRAHPGPLGAIVATANLVDCVPMIAMNDISRDGCHRLFVGDDCLWRTRPGGGPAIDVSGQLPYGDFTPGRWAWLLDDVKPTTERCPACWGYGWTNGRVNLTDYGTGVEYDADPCLTCGDGEETGTGKCDPIPVKGKQRLWRWTP